MPVEPIEAITQTPSRIVVATLVALWISGDPQAVAPRTTAFRRRFREVHFVHT